eukprot:1163013-Amphidinium_carterae.1
MNLTSDHEKLKQLMVRLDGNNPSTQQRTMCNLPKSWSRLLEKPCTYPYGEELQHHKVTFADRIAALEDDREDAPAIPLPDICSAAALPFEDEKQEDEMAKSGKKEKKEKR